MAYSGYSSWAGNWQVLRGWHVKGISASILQQWKQALLHLFNIICFSLFEQSRVDSLYKDRWDVEDDSAGSQSSGEVRLKAKCWLTASSWCTLTQASCGEHLSQVHRYFVPPQSTCQSHTVRQSLTCYQWLWPPLRIHARISWHIYICMCLWERGYEATSIFSTVHWALPLLRWSVPRTGS